MEKKQWLRMLTVLSLLSVAACSDHEVRKDYLKSRVIPPLQLPADIDPGILARNGQVPGSAQVDAQGLDPDALIKPPQIVDEQRTSRTHKGDVSRLPVVLKRDDNGLSYLFIKAGFDVVWREIRLSLVATGFTLTDLNRTDGLFYIRYRDPEDERDEYVIQLIRSAGGCRVLIRGVEGNILATDAAIRILSLLKTNL